MWGIYLMYSFSSSSQTKTSQSSHWLASCFTFDLCILMWRFLCIMSQTILWGYLKFPSLRRSIEFVTVFQGLFSKPVLSGSLHMLVDFTGSDIMTFIMFSTYSVFCQLSIPYILVGTFFFWEAHLPPRNLDHSAHTPGSFSMSYTKTLFQNNSYESVYGLTRLHTKGWTKSLFTFQTTIKNKTFTWDKNCLFSINVHKCGLYFL